MIETSSGGGPPGEVQFVAYKTTLRPVSLWREPKYFLRTVSKAVLGFPFDSFSSFWSVFSSTRISPQLGHYPPLTQAVVLREGRSAVRRTSRIIFIRWDSLLLCYWC